MTDLPIQRPAGANTGGRPSIPPDQLYRHGEDGQRESTPGNIRGRLDSRPVGLGSAVGYFVALLFLFVMAAALAQFEVRADRNAGVAPTTPPVTQDQTPAQPSAPADGNPAGSTTRDAVTP